MSTSILWNTAWRKTSFLLFLNIGRITHFLYTFSDWHTYVICLICTIFCFLSEKILVYIIILSMRKESWLYWLLFSIYFVLDFYLFEMYGQGICRIPFVIQRQHKFIMMNAFDFVSFLNSFLSLIVTPSSHFFVFFCLLGVVWGLFVCCFIMVLFVLDGSNCTDILCCVNTMRSYFPPVLFHTFTS